MRLLIKNIQKRLLTGFVAVFSMFSIAVARLERNPQSCGMINSRAGKKTLGSGLLRAK